ncbi:MAG: RHS repeat-associated core domain-containing protein [Cellvibrio sp.]|uniref:RHS repeat domain-containing protein n=1 Tax=Cellvibrio sp. TaxID=1965322 RepID=UPI002719A9B8|nr:RHS repeat-associated core domain-containing protein [Cellvibrio sp.]
MTKYVGGIYEEVTKDGVTQKIHYVGDFALFISKGDNTSATYAHEYLHRDHIGSIVAISKGTIATVADVSWQANGAWGARRFNQWNGPLDSLLNPTSTAKGFTDHEHLDSVGLIHMNGRVYDPELGRFMSADPFVQAPYNSQSYNRYSYVFNNPLSFRIRVGLPRIVIIRMPV